MLTEGLPDEWLHYTPWYSRKFYSHRQSDPIKKHLLKAGFGFKNSLELNLIGERMSQKETCAKAPGGDLGIKIFARTI